MAKYIQGKDGKMAGSIGDGKHKVPTAAAAPLPHPYAQPASQTPAAHTPGSSFGIPVSELRMQEIAEIVGADLGLDAMQVRATVASWRRSTDYEDVQVPDAQYRYDLYPDVPQDEDTQRALRKLGYEQCLAQPHPVFVYGTLRSGQGNHRLMSDAVEELHTATAEGVGIYGAHRGFPYAVEHDDPDARTVGEVIWLTQDNRGSQARESLDHLEGFDSDRPSTSHYERTLRTVKYTNDAGETHNVQAWIYLARGWSKSQLVESDRIDHGDWVEAKNSYRDPRPRYSWWNE
jgi:gamma-glutamylcyclotransferase (GGCT)/AIG2-like uncharacterized protein YtfP